MEQALKDVAVGGAPNLDDPDLPSWLHNVLLMAVFGYDERQVNAMSSAVKIRLLFVYNQIQNKLSPDQSMGIKPQMGMGSGLHLPGRF